MRFKMNLAVTVLCFPIFALVYGEESSYFPQKQVSESGPYPRSRQPESGPYPASGQPEMGPSPESGQPASATYQPSPSGRLLIFPARQQSQAAATRQTYGRPATSSSTSPSDKPPIMTTVTYQEIEEPTSTETAVEHTPPPMTEAEAENVGQSSAQQQQTSASGSYYILLQDGRLQQVTYSTMPLHESAKRLQEASINQPKTEEFVANVKYQEVQPITGPIYTYNLAPLIRIYK